MFIDLMKRFDVVDRLETLKLQSGDDFSLWFEPADFTNALSQCTSLHSLDLTLGDVESWEDDDSEPSPLPLCLNNLPQHFPDKVEHLRFRGPQDIASDLSVWLQCAAKSSWLPNLKALSFKLDTDKPSTMGADAHVQEFLGALLESHPAVQIIP